MGLSDGQVKYVNMIFVEMHFFLMFVEAQAFIDIWDDKSSLNLGVRVGRLWSRRYV